MRYNTMAMLCSSVCLALYAGCVTPAADPEPAGTTEPAPNDTEAAEPGVILRLDVESGHTVTFYEPVPGGLYLVERMTTGQKFVLGDREASNALAAFARLRPQAEVPAVLQAAYDRARNLPGDPSAPVAFTFGGGQPASTQAPTTPGVIEQALTSSSSAANFVNVDHGCDWGPTAALCRVNWGGGFVVSATSTSALCTVDHYAGNGITIQITVGTTVTSQFQGVHTSALYSLGAAGPVVYRRLDITNAAGDSFHAGCRWGN
jgi:hypothetical protein